jgi:hypothetical protein
MELNNCETELNGSVQQDPIITVAGEWYVYQLGPEFAVFF